jgi:GST-like protein
MAGQNGHFSTHAPEKIAYAINRYVNETKRLYGVLEKRLEGREFIAGEYSIADIACYPWIVPHEAHGQNLDDFPNVKRWFGSIASRPSTLRAYEGAQPSYAKDSGAKMTEEERKVLFGQK